MLIYRVETRFCVEDSSESISKYPSSPYSHTAFPSPDSHVWLQENGINFNSFCHHFYSPGFRDSNIPTVYEDRGLYSNLKKFYMIERFEGNFSKFLNPFIFGFESTSAIRRWFIKEERADLEDFGFYVAIYEVPDDHVVLGDKQLLFIREYAVQTGYMLFSEI
ncbi:hypothetical protein CkP1_0011 [Citrobacter phage CkP1]|nr:hypothetical protein CkP1_0011 [Citrobacter phage CkP1]